MFSRSVCFVGSLIAVGALFTATARSADVSYDGLLYGENFQPMAGGFVIAGTFAADFDPAGYHCYYADDDSCNMDTTHYSEAVADGNFFPIGTGTLTALDGYFSGMGATTAAEGTPIYLFLFDHPDPDSARDWALVTSTHASYQAPGPGGSTTVHGADADVILYGYKIGDAIALNVLPFPEPTSGSLAAFGAILAANGRWSRRRCA